MDTESGRRSVIQAHSCENISEDKVENSGYSIRPFLIIALVSLVIYLYTLSFLVWNELSVEDIRLQTGSLRQENIPWYLYPMSLGLTGLLALAFILLYFFRKFEKEVFVFGIIAIIALLTGPYYDEHRLANT